jgi:hypothetical protein
MRSRITIGAAIFLLVSSGTSLHVAAAEQGLADCEAISSNVFDPETTVLPDPLLADWRPASICLLLLLDQMATRVSSPELSADDLQPFVKATGALNTIIATFDGKAVIQHLRANDTIDVASALSWGARNVERSARLNATMLLANIVDNNTICVPIDHLYDTDFIETANGINGRANLLSVVSVISPWAHRENYHNILRLVEQATPQIEGPNLEKTRSLIGDICRRLGLQETYSAPNKNTPLPPSLRACGGYKATWAGTKLQYNGEIEELDRGTVCAAWSR